MAMVHVISWKKLDDFIIKHPNSESSLKSWYKILKNTSFNDFNDLRKLFNSVDLVGNLTVFNISGNNFRLIAAIHFNTQKVFIRYILTHSDYDKGKWKKEII
ncbi:type II toxin-antitoxin system HigB family toxin [Leptospira wolbachii]|uniref:type II toxin-antitoxin system HigB family toxin n=1 Tax=Leptospira wolbachii TaxID=29511 RepID=UPI0026838A8B